VSTDGQNLDAQEAALKSAGCVKVYAEKISGARRDRPQLELMLTKIKAGDTVIVTRLDRLARSTLDLLRILSIMSEVPVTFKSLADTWADTTTPHGRLMVTVLGGLAEFERSLILARTSEGRTRAKAKGIRFGRKPVLTRYQCDEARARRAAGESLKEIARSFNCSHMTIQRATTDAHP
jgi:DNA invertase Pin-like site-specific DNA recombinase